VGHADEGQGHDGTRGGKGDRQSEGGDRSDDEGKDERATGRRVERRAVPYLGALALTLVLEVPLVVLGLGSLGVDRRRSALLAVVATLVTHPLLWFVVAPAFDDAAGLAGIVAAEVLVVLAEGAVFAVGARPRVGYDAALCVAVLANGVSFVVGLLLG
jgi:hypothetical protein